MPAADEDHLPARMLQIMTTEHFVLQTARAATIQEANQRANLFLTSVSSAAIALAFVAQVTRMGGPFVLFSMILLPCVYFIGLVTFIRTVQVGIEDMVHARGLARIRHFYVELAPEVGRYLVHAIHDDAEAVRVDKGLRASRWQDFVTTAGMVSAVDAAIAGVFGGVAARAVAGWPVGFAVASGAALFLSSALLFDRHHRKAWAAAERALPPVFPADRQAPT
jgi:hypothetical protein